MTTLTRNQRPHGEPGHLSTRERDQESDITGLGKHNRLSVSCDAPAAGRPPIIYITEDFKHDLPASTDAQRRKVANGWQRLHPPRTRLEYLYSTDKYRVTVTAESWESQEHHYRVIYPQTAGQRQGRHRTSTR